MYLPLGFVQLAPLVHNELMNFNEWLTTLPGSPTASQAANAAKVSRATVLRHEAKGQTTAEYAVEIARAYELNEVQALIDMEFINEAAVLELAVEIALSYATNSQILAEMRERTDPNERRVYGGEGMPGVIGLKKITPVPELPDDLLENWQDHAVADESPDHDEEDTDFG